MHNTPYHYDYLTPHFTRTEMACRHCGQGYVWPGFMAALEQMRVTVNRPFHILSGHRCALHNARIGGAPLSQHLKLAVDISLYGHDIEALLSQAKRAGFTGFGFYETFFHIDMGPTRHWYGSEKAKRIWQTS